MTAVDMLKEHKISSLLRTSPPPLVGDRGGGTGSPGISRHPDTLSPLSSKTSNSPPGRGKGWVTNAESLSDAATHPQPLPGGEFTAPPRSVRRDGESTVISINDLHFRWSQRTPLVLDIDSLQIQQGERVFIAGPSGSGKSTLLSLLAGVVTPQQGQISVLGKRIDQLNSVKRDHFRSDHIGFIFQMFNLIPYLSVVENVTLPCQFSKRRRARVLSKNSNLKEEALRLLTHLDMADPVLLNRAVTDLSVGQQQRVAAARALIGAPEIVIADEPTSSLDADNREAFVKLLFQECQQEGSTLVFVSHDMFLESFFDRTIRLAEINRV